MNTVVKTEDLSHQFDDNQVLDQISLRIQQGEIFGLLGPSGAGKTTLARILTGQMEQKSGYAELLEKDTKKLSPLEYGQIGMMMDNWGFYERLSVYDNMIFYADIYHVPKRTIYDTLECFGLADAVKTPVFRLSKGMKNRLSLARALMNEPKVLFLDEPAAGLDPSTAREIHRILKSWQEKGTTIFLTTHNMFEAESICDNIALLHKGQIIEYGKPAEIRRKYNHLNKLQITLKDGTFRLLGNNRGASGILKEYLEQEVLETIHSTEPTLETVFVELTGRGLDSYE